MKPQVTTLVSNDSDPFGESSTGDVSVGRASKDSALDSSLSGSSARQWNVLCTGRMCRVRRIGEGQWRRETREDPTRTIAVMAVTVSTINRMGRNGYMCSMEVLIAMNEDVLTRVFQHLTVEELIHSALLVCRKWRDVVLLGLHRRMPVPIFQILNHGTSAKDSPLRRYHTIIERNLLCDLSTEDYPLQKELLKNWWLTKAGFCTLSKFNEQDTAGLLPDANAKTKWCRSLWRQTVLAV